MNQQHFVTNLSQVDIWEQVQYDYDSILKDQFEAIIQDSVNLVRQSARPTIPCWTIDND